MVAVPCWPLAVHGWERCWEDLSSSLGRAGTGTTVPRSPTTQLAPKAGAQHGPCPGSLSALASGLCTLGWHPRPQGRSQHAGITGPLWQRQMKVFGAVTGVMDGLRALAGSGTQTLRMWREPPRFRPLIDEMQVPAVPLTISLLPQPSDRDEGALNPRDNCLHRRTRRVGFFPPLRCPSRSKRVPGKSHHLADGSAAPQGLGVSSKWGGSRATTATKKKMLRGAAGAKPKERAMAAKGNW